MRFFFRLLTAAVFTAAAPLAAAAQDGGQPIRPNPNAQFVYQNGEVLQRLGDKSTRLGRNVKLPDGTKINYKSGMVEMPGGKIITLRQNDYVKADGGVVYATPGSAAYARGDNTVPANTKFDTYVQVGAASGSASEELRLLHKKVDLLTRKAELLGKGQTPPPALAPIDAELRETDEALAKLPASK
jgi:hypothetical protein